jgi:hypothetical protein
MKNYETNRQWSDRFIPSIKTILGPLLITEASFGEDASRATDLVVFELKSVRIACRVRKYHYAAKYGHEFTVRSHLESGSDTELFKILSGWGDFMLYGFCDPAEQHVQYYSLIDLQIFREWYMNEMRSGSMYVGTPRSNFDGTKFRVFDLRTIAYRGKTALRYSNLPALQPSMF